jgi:GNAT superfamily N-acetyltransferase
MKVAQHEVLGFRARLVRRVPRGTTDASRANILFTMPDFTIRPATADDIPLLLRHRRMMWWDMGRRDEAALDLADQAAAEYFADAISCGMYRGFLAIDDAGQVIGGGGIVISPWPSLLGQRQPRRAMILNVYVEPCHRRRGVARKLMETMIEWCRENGFVNVALHASEEGRQLYEQLGFKPTNEMKLDLR